MKLTQRVIVVSLALAIIGSADAQAPKPMSIEEQIRIFSSLSPEQQQAVIDEVKRQVPPEQAEKIIAALQSLSRAPAAR